jgi:hypothetical protein
MAKKSLEQKIDALTHIVEKSFGAVAGDIARIERTMATKDDIARLDVKIDKLDLSLHRELESIKQELKNVSGFGKEIDHALERIAAIEKHLGIEKKIAA